MNDYPDLLLCDHDGWVTTMEQEILAWGLPVRSEVVYVCARCGVQIHLDEVHPFGD